VGGVDDVIQYIYTIASWEPKSRGKIYLFDSSNLGLIDISGFIGISFIISPSIVMV
jgi:hypothetical protein